MLEWANPTVQGAALEAAGTVLAAIMATVAAGIFGKRYANRKRLEDKLARAIADIDFLLAVEREHGEIHRELEGASRLRTVRTRVRNAGYTWSGAFTPGRVKLEHSPQPNQAAQYLSRAA